jgi:hypothetical protein
MKLWDLIKKFFGFGGNTNTNNGNTGNTGNTGNGGTTTPPVTPPADPVLDLTSLSWDTGNFKAPTAKKDPKVTVSGVNLSLSMLTWTIAGVTGNSNWPNDGETYGLDCLWFERDGKWRGGKFDWDRCDGVRNRPTSAHVQGGGSGFYGGWGKYGPYVKGEKFRALLVSKDGKWCSNLAEGIVK